MKEEARATTLDQFGIRARNPRQGRSFVNEEITPPVIEVLIYEIHLRKNLEEGIFFDGFNQFHENPLIKNPKMVREPYNIERIENLSKALII